MLIRPMMFRGAIGGGVEQPNPTITSFTFAETSGVTLTNGNRTATAPSGGQGGARSGNSAASIAATFTVGANGFAYVGVSNKATPVDNPFGGPGGFGYGKDGDLYVNGAYVGVKAVTYTSADTIKVATSSTSVFFYKNGTLVYTAARASGDTAILYPTAFLIEGSATIA